MFRLIGLGLAAALSIAGQAVADTVSTFTLKNGMEVVVIEDHRAPVVVHMVWYRIGAADESAGHSGIAHFLEHLMFKGTDEVASGDFSAIVEAQGGSNDALAATQMGADGDVFEHRHLAEQSDVLESPAHAAAGDVARSLVNGRVAKEGDLPLTGRVDAGQHQLQIEKIMRGRSHRVANAPARELAYFGDATLGPGNDFYIIVTAGKRGEDSEVITLETIYPYHCKVINSWITKGYTAVSLD